MDFSVVLFDNDPSRDSLLPLVATRPVGNLRVGVLTLNKKWELIFGVNVSYFTVSYLKSKFSLADVDNKEVLIIKASVLPNLTLVNVLRELKINQLLKDKNGDWIAVKIPNFIDFEKIDFGLLDEVFYESDLSQLVYPEDIFLFNADQIKYDLQIMTMDKSLSNNGVQNQFLGNDFYIHNSAQLNGAVLDSSKGPIYIGADSVIESGVVLNGPVAIGDNCRVKAGAVIYSNVTIGDDSTVCGELNNTVIWGNSAKGHYGYLGCAVLGEGCNLGAGTTNSNLKNDWSTVKLYDYVSNGYRDTGIAKCGVVIGDQVMLGIQSMITTGTVIGVGAQIAMSKFIPKFVPDFSWMTDGKCETYIFDRFAKMMQRKAGLKKENLTDDDLFVLKHVHHITNILRSYNQH